MAKHLAGVHKKVLPNVARETNQQTLTELFCNAPKKRKSDDGELQKNLQYVFNRKIALWICRDLLPFDTITKDGFKDFWNSMNHTPNVPLPCRATISVSALDDLFDCCKKKFKEILAASPEHGTITFDCWQDNAKRTSYVTYTYHYMQDWTIQTAVLKTAMLSKPHTGERLREHFEEAIQEYELSEKKITVVTDGGSNIVKACRLMNIWRMGCIGHIVHNVVTRDLMESPAVQELIDFMAHIREIQRKLTYKHAELKTIHDTEKHKEVWAALEEFQENGKFTESNTNL